MALLAAAMSAGAVAGGVFSGWLPKIRRQGLLVVAAILVWGLADATHGAAAAVVGTTIAAAGGGVLVVVGVLIAALAVPAFVRYRAVASDRPR